MFTSKQIIVNSGGTGSVATGVTTPTVFGAVSMANSRTMDCPLCKAKTGEAHINNCPVPYLSLKDTIKLERNGPNKLISYACAIVTHNKVMYNYCNNFDCECDCHLITQF